MPVLIAGGGIGGLAAAIALARQGVAVHVLEAAETFAEIGAGIQIGPNGMHILERWGLGQRLRAQAFQPECLLIRDGLTGGVLARAPLGSAIEARHGAPYLSMARHVLHAALLEAAQAEPNVTLSCGTRVACCSVIEDEVFFGGANGSKPQEGRGLIAADGVHSVLRRHFFPGARAAPSGNTALRALVPIPPGFLYGEERAVTVWMAPNAHLVHYPIGDAGVLNVVAVLSDRVLPEAAEPQVDAGVIAAAFRKWSRDAQDVVSGASVWRRWPLFAMPALAEWSRGPITLLGDAAHPILPFLASGAVMAIEDAAVLAQEMSRSPQDCAAAFQRYEACRIPRIGRLLAAVTRAGETYHMSGVRRLVRNLALAAMPRRKLLARNDWLYGFRV